LQAANVQVGDLSGIGVVTGPGMFTSLRVGLAVAQGLSLPHRIPVRGLNTLEALASSVPGNDSLVLTLVDARKQQVYAALYRGREPVVAPAVARPDELADLLRPQVTGEHALRLAGNGISLCLAALAPLGLPLEQAEIESPTPITVARLARKDIRSMGGEAADRLVPFYLRRTDAELQREKETGPGTNT
jgi:tRNA threonylcarbamoyladenosine biosynthesis protein TsaB